MTDALVLSLGRAQGATAPRRTAANAAKLLALLAIVGTMSVLLIPRGVELASLRAKSGNPDAALQLLEEAHAKGDRSSATMSALARQRAQSGNLAGGIALLETMVGRQPDDPTLLESLGALYGQADRGPEQLTTLERLQRIDPQASRQRQIAGRYGALGQTRRQADLLADLVTRFDNAEVADWLLLARLHSQLGEHTRALATLDRMVAKFPKADDASVVAAQMTAALAGGDASGALARGRARLTSQPRATAADAPAMAGALMAGGRADLAVRLLDPLVGKPPVEAGVLIIWAQAMSDAGRMSDALARLDLEQPTPTDTSLQTLRLNLALAVGKPHSALESLRAIGTHDVAPAALIGAANLALSTRHIDSLRHLLDTAQNGIGRHDPLLAVRVAEALGNRTAALRWLAAADSEPERQPARALQRVRLLSQTSQPQRAADLLRRTAPPVNDLALLTEFARLHITLDSVAQGLAAIERALPTRSEADATPAWALLAAADGRQDAVLRWLDSAGAQRADDALLRDLHHLAMQAKRPSLAVAAAERLVARNRHTARDSLLLVNALMSAGRSAEASSQLAAVRQRVTVSDELYGDVLLAAWRQGEPVGAELRRLQIERLARQRDPALRAASVTILVELGAHADALGALEQLAAADPRRWLPAYLESAVKAGQKRRTAGLLNRLATTLGSLPEELRPQIAFRLLEAGDKLGAERVFRALAAGAGPRAETTQRLLYVWGPRPTAPQREWLEERADAATGRDRAAWMRLLTERGGAAQAMKVYRRTQWPQPDGDDLLEAFLEAAATGGELGVLASTLKDAAARTRSAPLLARLARQAAVLNDPRLERRLLESALAAGHTDPSLRRSLGLLIYQNNDWRAAEPHLAAYAAATGGDGATHRALGEIALQRGDTGSARKSFERALAAFEAKRDPSYAGRVALASLLQRLNQQAAARRLYDELLAERPHDDNLRADYAAMLLDMGHTSSARALLKP